MEYGMLYTPSRRRMIRIISGVLDVFLETSEI